MKTTNVTRRDILEGLRMIPILLWRFGLSLLCGLTVAVVSNLLGEALVAKRILESNRVTLILTILAIHAGIVTVIIWRARGLLKGKKMAATISVLLVAILWITYTGHPLGYWTFSIMVLAAAIPSYYYLVARSHKRH